MGFVDRMKVRWHLDLASNEATHGWMLNLYRAGEQHPETVQDYFPFQHAPWPDLARSIERHAADERRHTRLYTALLERVGQPVEELRGWDVYNQVIRDHTHRSWAIAEDDAAEDKRRSLAHFMAHANCLERRVLMSLEYHMEACAQLGDRRVVKLMEGVYRDELRHVGYTGEALAELTTRAEAEDILELHQHAEAAADRAFSATQVRALLARYAGDLSLSSRLFYAACGVLMERAPLRPVPRRRAWRASS